MFQMCLQQAAIIDESQESFSMEDVKDNNKQLQQKMQKNEKLIRHLQMERTDHERILKVNSKWWYKDFSNNNNNVYYNRCHTQHTGNH